MSASAIVAATAIESAAAVNVAVAIDRDVEIQIDHDAANVEVTTSAIDVESVEVTTSAIDVENDYDDAVCAIASDCNDAAIANDI